MAAEPTENKGGLFNTNVWRKITFLLSDSKMWGGG